MASTTEKIKKFFSSPTVILFVVGIIFATTTIVFAANIKDLHGNGAFQLKNNPVQIFTGRKKKPTTIGPIDPAVIEPWMTFEYINTVHALPQSFLKESLGIQTTRYPRTTVGFVAREKNTPTDTEIQEIEVLIAGFNKKQVAP